MLEIKNAVVVAVFIFIKHNGLCERSADSNYFYRVESILCTNFCVCIMSLACTFRVWSCTRYVSIHVYAYVLKI